MIHPYGEIKKVQLEQGGLKSSAFAVRRQDADKEGGLIWMLTTPAIEEYPHTFAREAKRFVERRKEPLLWNIVDERNTVHLKLLRFLGFKFLRKKLHGPHNLSFIEFCRVRS